MDATTRYFDGEWQEAERLAYSARDGEALNVCWRLRLQPALSIYLRARVNLLIATLLMNKSCLKFAKECIDLLKLMKEEFHVSDEQKEHLKDLEDAAQAIVNEEEKLAEEDNTIPAIVLDPQTGMLSDIDQPLTSPTKGIANKLELVSFADTDPAHEDVELQPDLDSIMYGEPVSSTSDGLKIEGFLRDKSTRDANVSVPAQTGTTGAMEVETTGIDARLTPIASSPLQRSGK
ncbi:hypothetical protein LTR05_008726 [Lithohypha guttulata]|uniref:Uncharacterized protein n=1 Tax=Lithohypha guttulata TaxID=1690604 RepID=A0AAN7QPJ1_9EURO|nr:hypothetical protein LTR05_008726 [Lithohypha guttulata]